MRQFTLCMLMLLGGCAAQPEIQRGPDAEVSYDGLYRVDNTEMQNVWLKPNTDLSHYQELMLVSTGVHYRAVERSGPLNRQANAFPLSDAQKENIELAVGEALLQELSGSEYFTVTETPGPDVLEITLGLHDVVSRVPEPRGVRDEFYLTNLGEGLLVVEVRDSMSDEVFVRISDRQDVEPMTAIRSNPVSNLSEVKRSVARWGIRLRNGLDELHRSGCVFCTELEQ